MATCSSLLLNRAYARGWVHKKNKCKPTDISEGPIWGKRVPKSGMYCSTRVSVSSHHIDFSASNAKFDGIKLGSTEKPLMHSIQRLSLADIDPATAKAAIPIVGPFLSAFGLLFIIRIVMSWYPKLPETKFPYVIAYAATEPILGPTRKVIRPVGGVDISPIVWFGLISFLNEILVGKQGLLVLISQQVN